MTKHEVYKQYDNIFNNRKIRYIKTQICSTNNGKEKLKIIYKKRLSAFSVYCGTFINKNICKVSADIHITRKNGIEKFYNWGGEWRSIVGDWNMEDCIEKCLPFISDEGKKVYKKIEKINPEIKFKRKMISVGTIQPHHKKYYYLPSYTNSKKNYPINLIIKEYNSAISISIPAFHRYPIISNYTYQSDAESLKRQMLLIEFYEDIKKHLLPIIKKQKKEIKWIRKNNEKIIQDVAKYEMITNM